MAFVGSCEDMCPEAERALRFGIHMSIFERDQSSMVKEYRRSGADQEEPQSEDLRTPEALARTMNYLGFTIMNDCRSTAPEYALDWYEFLWDRLRAIRKDITQQNICDQNAAELIEKCARFHIHSCYAMNHVKDFEVDMNKKNLNDCLQMLRQMYSDLKYLGIECSNEMEFTKYDILLHLSEDHLSSHTAMKLSDRTNQEIKFTIEVFNAYTNNNYYKFFKLMQQADYMTSSILSMYVNKMRSTGFRTIKRACMGRQAALYPFELAIDILGFDGYDDLNEYATLHNIETQVKDSKHYIVISKDLRVDGNQKVIKSKKLVENKIGAKTVGHLICGPQISAAFVQPTRQLISSSVDNSLEDAEDTDRHGAMLSNEQPRNNESRPVDRSADMQQPGDVIEARDMVDLSSSSSSSSAALSRCRPLESEQIFDEMQETDGSDESGDDNNNMPELNRTLADDEEAAATAAAAAATATQTIGYVPSSSSPADEPHDQLPKCHHTEQTVSSLHVQPELSSEIIPQQQDDSPEPTSMNSISRIPRIIDMPVGRFIKRTLSSKCPILRMPSELPCASKIPPVTKKRYEPRLDTLTQQIEDENKVNKVFARLTSIIGNM